MVLLYTIILAFVQGLTEFLPVSSSGHLVVLHDVLSFSVRDSVAFDLFLHWGTTFAVIYFFRLDLLKLLRAFFGSIWSRSFADGNARIAWYIVFSTIPAAVIGWFFEDALGLFRNDQLVGALLIAGGVLFFVVEWAMARRRTRRDLHSLSISDALFIGFAQASALIPGVSRSGITIVSGLFRGFGRAQAARFSFLLSVPIILGAGIKKSTDIWSTGLERSEILIYVLGFVVAFVSGLVAIGFLLKYLEKRSLTVFGWYRIVLGIVILLLV